MLVGKNQRLDAMKMMAQGENERMFAKKLTATTALACLTLASSLFGATVYYDIEAGDVTSLTNALAASRNGNTVVIRLAAGDYDLTGIEMDSGSHLYLDSRALVGQGDSPWKTRLIGNGKRVVKANNPWYGNSTGCRIENLTVTNGWTTGNGGGVSGYPHVINCVVIGNHADGNGGGLGGYDYCNRSVVMNNTASGNGGGASTPNFVYNSEIVGNSAKNGGGIWCDGLYGSATNCTISGNTATQSGGGVRCVRTVNHCRVVGNVAGADGGGLMGPANSPFGAAMGCTVCSNKTTSTDSNSGYGGGVCNYGMTNCTVFANYGRHGGGASGNSCISHKCRFHDNYAVGYGGAAYRGVWTECVFADNIAGSGGHNAYAARLIGCDVSGTGVTSGSAVGCTFHDVGRAVELANPHVAAAVTNVHVYTGIPVCTNCLFANNRQAWCYDGKYGKSYGQVIFQGADNATLPGQIVNCTIVSNVVGQMFSYCRTSAQPWNVENSVFFGNRCYYGNADIVNYDYDVTGGIYFKSCAYGISGGKMSDPSGWTKAGDVNYKFGVDGFAAKPGFVCERDPQAEHPFALWRTSALRGRGTVEDWMANAYDIRGDADNGAYRRIRDGKCDIGCYQCWMDMPGFVVIVE